MRVLEGAPLSPFLGHLAMAPAGWAFVKGSTATTTQDGISIELDSAADNPDGASARAALRVLTRAGG